MSIVVTNQVKNISNTNGLDCLVIPSFCTHGFYNCNDHKIIFYTSLDQQFITEIKINNGVHEIIISYDFGTDVRTEDWLKFKCRNIGTYSFLDLVCEKANVLSQIGNVENLKEKWMCEVLKLLQL